MYHDGFLLCKIIYFDDFATLSYYLLFVKFCNM